MLSIRCFKLSDWLLPEIIVVWSFVTMIFLTVPNWSNVTSFNSIERSLLIKVLPVRAAISSNVAFWLSPNPGAFVATTLNVPLNLFKTRVEITSFSKSSAINNNGLLLWTICSRTGRISCKLLILWFVIKI